MADIYLLTEAERKYFSHLTGAFSKILTKERICPQKLEMTEEQLKRVCEGLPYSPANALKKWERVLSKPYFMLMRAERYTPAPQKPDTEPLAPNEYFLSAPGGSKARYMVTAEWHYLQGDSLSTFFNTPIAHPIEETEQAYKLITEYADSMGSDAEKMNAVRNALGLSDYSYIPFGLFSTMASVAAVCKEYLKTPAEPGLSEGRSRQNKPGSEFFRTADGLSTVIAGDGYAAILQSKVTNALAHASCSTFEDDIDPITGAARAAVDGVEIIANNFNDIILNVPTHKVYDAVVQKLTRTLPHGAEATAERIARSRSVELSIAEYMKLCNLKDRKEARDQLIEAARALYELDFRWTEQRYTATSGKKGRGKTTQDKNMRLFDAKGAPGKQSPVVRGKIELQLTYDAAEHLSHSYIMPFPIGLYGVKVGQNPHSYYIGRRLAEHHNMNIGKANSNRISVKALLAACPDLPKYEDIINTAGKNVTQQIIKPFERDLIALKTKYNTLESWAYCNSNGEPLTDEQVESYSYDVWQQWLVEFTLCNYPDQSDRLAKAAELKRIAEKRKKAAKEETGKKK